MKVLKSLNSLNVEGSDAYTFIDSLVSNSINENEYKFSYLLGPDGKVNFWFIFSRQNDLLKIYQSESNLIEFTSGNLYSEESLVNDAHFISSNYSRTQPANRPWP